MSDHTETAKANANGLATATIQLPNAGLVWVVAQVSIETRPFRVGCTAVIRRNGSLISSSSIGSADTAYGPPSILLRVGDILTVDWTGLTVGDQGIAIAFYKEEPDSSNPTPNVVV